MLAVSGHNCNLRGKLLLPQLMNRMLASIARAATTLWFSVIATPCKKARRTLNRHNYQEDSVCDR
jgi:hypothetical protein